MSGPPDDDYIIDLTSADISSSSKDGESPPGQEELAIYREFTYEDVTPLSPGSDTSTLEFVLEDYEDPIPRSDGVIVDFEQGNSQHFIQYEFREIGTPDDLGSRLSRLERRNSRCLFINSKFFLD